MPWYDGPSAARSAREAPAADEQVAGPLRLPVQWVCRSNQDFRGFAGTLSAGRGAPGDAVVGAALGAPQRASRASSRPTAICRSPGPGRRSRSRSPTRSTSAAATCSPRPPRRRRWPTSSPRTCCGWTSKRCCPARLLAQARHAHACRRAVTEIKHRLDVNTQEHLAAASAGAQRGRRVNLVLDEPIAFEPYARTARSAASS
jgi:bifunctional enzyme CysN/CysC